MTLHDFELLEGTELDEHIDFYRVAPKDARQAYSGYALWRNRK